MNMNTTSKPAEGPVADDGISSMGASVTAKVVVIVDDEPMVATVTQHCLRRGGYETVVFDDPVAARDWLGTPENHADMMITDHAMPQLTGTELARSVHEFRPDLPVIICSGYVNAVYEETSIPDNVKVVLAKPVPTNMLLHEVEKATRSR